MSDGMNQVSSVITDGAPPPISTAIHAVLTFCSNGSFPAFASPQGRTGHRQEQKAACMGWVQPSDMTLGEKSLQPEGRRT